MGICRIKGELKEEIKRKEEERGKEEEEERERDVPVSVPKKT